MGAQIAVYNGGQRVAITNMAFDTTVKTELMREKVLNFSVVNSDNARQYAIDENAQFVAEGQMYDTKNYKQMSGTDNITNITAFHILTRMNNYMIPAGYSFVGTVAEIVQDILNVSGADVEFTVGTCIGGFTSYTLTNTQPITAYSAIMNLTKLGVEPSFDNFIINAPTRWGADTDKIFKFERDLCSLERTFDKTTTPWTYSYGIDVANLQRIAGALSSDTFNVGDTVGIQDALIGDAIIGQRIMTYEKCLDDPTQDKVIIGDFITDMADDAFALQIVIDNKVQQAIPYSNVSIDHQNGFMAKNEAGDFVVKMNGTDGFIATLGGTEVLMNPTDGFKASMGNVEVIMNAEKGFEIHNNGVLVGGVDTEGAFFASKMQNPDDNDIYATLGYNGTSGIGLKLFYNDLGTLYNYIQINPGEVGGVNIKTKGDFSIIREGCMKSIVASNDRFASLVFDDGVNETYLMLDSSGASIMKNGTTIWSV